MQYKSVWCLLCGIILCCLSISPSIADVTVNGHTYQWANWNTGSVVNGPPEADTIFSISKPVAVTYLDSYHYYNGEGVSWPGEITLVSDSGKKFGPFQMDSIENNYVIWHLVIQEGDLILPAGTYTVYDSDPNTWSSNAASDGAGLFGINWEPVAGSGSSTPSGKVQPVTPKSSEGIIGSWIWIDGSTVNMESDGAVIAIKNGKSIPSGTWTKSGDSYKITWDNGYADTMTLSADGKSMTGVNNQGVYLSVKRA